MIELNKIYNENCLITMANMPDNFVDMTLTSPPYDQIREYNGYSFDFESVAKQMFRITKNGGVIVWIVGDATISGSETGTSFKQALYFKEIGFNLHDTMIWNKGCFSAVGALKSRYAPVFEYMFVLSKGKIKSFNPIKDRKTLHGGKKVNGTVRNSDGSMKPFCKEVIIKEFGQRYNIWDISPQRQRGKNVHPAPFPETIAKDHILSWSNENELIYDPFMGSGTTAKMAKLNNRNYIGSEISKEYCEIIEKRLQQ